MTGYVLAFLAGAVTAFGLSFVLSIFLVDQSRWRE